MFSAEMSESDQDAVIGRTLREYRDAQREVAALCANAESIGYHLIRVGETLRSKHEFFDSHTTGGSLINLPTREGLLDLSKQIIVATENKERLAQLLKAAGFPPKD